MSTRLRSLVEHSLLQLSFTIYLCLLQVIRAGGSVGSVDVTWLINSTDESQQLLGANHEFVTTTGTVGFNASQTSANLTVSFVNDLTPSLDRTYQLTLVNLSQVMTTLISSQTRTGGVLGAVPSAAV